MCVICYKPGGYAMPSKKKIKTMFANNPDGAGFMYPAKDGKINIIKGLMTVEEFNKAITKAKITQETPLVMHFRITTNGGTSRGMCHPFPLSKDIKKLTATEQKTAVGIAHNGIIPMTNYSEKISDTAEFIRKYMTKLINKNNIDEDILEIIEAVIESKMAIMETGGNVHLLGHFVQDGNGIYYSNTSYQAPRKAKSTKAKTSDFATRSWYNDEYETTLYNECIGLCEFCKHEAYCLDGYSAKNPYNPEVYNMSFKGGEGLSVL